MENKVFIAVPGKVVANAIHKACLNINLTNITLMKNADNILNEIQKEKPEIIFILASIVEDYLEDSQENIITKIKEKLDDVFIVFLATRPDCTEYAFQMGADSFLTMPFAQEQFKAVLRNILQLQKKMLIIGSQTEQIKDLSKKLKNAGFFVENASDGASALELINASFPNLILCNSELKGDNCFEVCKTIKNSPLFFYIPIILLSEESSSENAEKGFESGVKEILLAPFASDSNLNKIFSIVTPPKTGKKEKILIVDDSKVIRNMIIKALKPEGYVLVTAVDGLDGYKMALKEKPDLITSDYEMPRMDGWEFCTELKKNDETKKIPIIMITTLSSDVDLRKGSILGVDAYLTKPFENADLIRTVSKIFDKSKKSMEEEALKKYMSSDTLRSVKDSITQGIEVKPQYKFISILFSDISKFTTMSERLDPQIVTMLLNNYFDLMVDVLLANNAIIDKFIGDAIVARFDTGDKSIDAYNAVKSAHEMLKALQEFNKHSFESLNMRVGVNSGKVILANLGSSKYRLDYTMIGDSVNACQRLESNAPINGCLISESTYELVKDKVETGVVNDLTMKGKTIPVKTYTVTKVF